MRVPRSVPPGHWYDDGLLEQNGQAGGQGYGDRDPRVLRGPSEPAEGTPPARDPRDAGQRPAHDPQDAGPDHQAGYDHRDSGGRPRPQDGGPGAPTAPYRYDPSGYEGFGGATPPANARPGPRDDNRGTPPGYDPRHLSRGNPLGYDPAGYETQQFAQGAPPRRDGRDSGPGTPPGPGGPGARGGPDETGQGHRHRHGKRGKPRRHLLRRLLSHRSVQAVLVVLVIFLGWVGWSIGQAMTAPGNGSASTRLAEWARDHYLGPVVTFGEWLTYQAPKVGGKPQFSLTAPTSGSSAAQPKTGTATITPIVPATLSSPAGTPVPGEGQWRVLASVHGVPAIYGTYLRPDSVHTSYVAGIASMDQRLLTFQLRPGAEDPGPGDWGYSPWLPPNSRSGLLATFNGGFKLDSSGGGFYLNGHTKGTLTAGAASLVYYKDGNVAIGSWGQGVSMTSQVLGVRQNLKLLVDHGVVPAAVDQDVQTQWGATLGGGYYVWRSGIGITRDGRVIWVYGPALSVRTLADLLQRAGAVEGMQMDINPAWMSYMYYKPTPSTADPTPVNLLPNQPEPANRYYSVNSRDFTAVFAR
jgi:Phosphodiester glycosidase